MAVRFELKGVSKFYQKKNNRGKPFRFPVLNNISLEIPGQQITALIGESGCGKSTLARVLARLESFDEGEMFYRSQPLYQTPIKTFRQQNQIMFQNPFLSVNPSFTVSKILSEPLVIARKTKKEIREKLSFSLDLLNLPDSYLSKYPSELSGGELQRVVLGRALVLEPEFIILDEPFSALDQITAARLIRQFKLIFHELQIGALIISHNLERVELLSQTIIRMQEGRVVASSKFEVRSAK
ncbi:MAG: ABC transporter ATP-binding protein [bacterium]|nr:ABC transporter ATP-binding protein [bacterium]